VDTLLRAGANVDTAGMVSIIYKFNKPIINIVFILLLSINICLFNG